MRVCGVYLISVDGLCTYQINSETVYTVFYTQIVTFLTAYNVDANKEGKNEVSSLFLCLGSIFVKRHISYVIFYRQ